MPKSKPNAKSSPSLILILALTPSPTAPVSLVGGYSNAVVPREHPSPGNVLLLSGSGNSSLGLRVRVRARVFIVISRLAEGPDSVRIWVWVRVRP